MYKRQTLSISSKKAQGSFNYPQSGRKTSVVIEKKPGKRWGEKKIQTRDNNFNKSKPNENFFPRKTQPNKNFDIRKMAEERATKRFKSLEKENLQPKKL